MHFAPRRSGRLKATVTAAHYLGGLEIVKILCRFCGQLPYSDLDREENLPWPKLTKRLAEDIIREAVLEYGRDAYFSDSDWSENYEDQEIGRIARWADEQMRRLYPNLIDADYREYVDPMTALADD